MEEDKDHDLKLPKTKQERLLYFMRKAPLSRKGLADLLQQTRSSISHYVNGSVKIPYGVGLALKAEYGMNPDWLETGEGDMYMPNSEQGWRKLDDIGKEIMSTYGLLEEEAYKKILHMNSSLCLRLQQEGKLKRGQKFRSDLDMITNFIKGDVRTLVDNFSVITNPLYRKLLLESSHMLVKQEQEDLSGDEVGSTESQSHTK